jgi:hypothetical protein
MTDAPVVPGKSGGSPQLSAVNLDTTAGSPLHVLLGVFDRIGVGAFAHVALYVAAVVATYLPLLIGAWLGPVSITVTQGMHRVPFLYDGVTMFTFLVSFPCMLILVATDQRVLSRSLNIVLADGSITIADADRIALEKRWYRLFRTTNLAAQALGFVVGSIVAYFNFRAFVPASAGHWIADNERLLPVGYVYLYCIFLFYAVASVYVVRSFAIAFLLRDIVARGQLHMLPLHPDKAGGLQPVGRLGLRNQYALTLFGLNVVVLMISYLILKDSDLVFGLVVVAIVAYLILGPLVFMAPLLPFRGGMLRNKAQLMSKVALRLRVELDHLHAGLASGAITAEDEGLIERIERLRKIGALIDELPVWPFDAATLRKFVTAYVLPIVSSVSFPAAKAVVGYFGIRIPFLS